MLVREEGASGPQIAASTGWRHTPPEASSPVSPEKGVKVQVLERVRRVGTIDICIICGMPAATKDRRKRDVGPATSHATGQRKRR